jgi:hypothetical protein
MSITDTRAKTHGDYNLQSALAQDLKRRIRQEGSRLSPQQLEALEMICVKIARICCGNPNEPDHWVDISGYAELPLKSLKGRTVMGATTEMEKPHEKPSRYTVHPY